MVKRPALNHWLSAALAALSWPAAACVVSVDSAVFEARDEKRFAVAGKPDVTVATFDGTIDVRAWDRPEVVVEIEKRASDKAFVDEIGVKAEHAGSRIVVEVTRPPASSETLRIGRRALFGFSGASARLTVSVPRECDVTAKSGDGNITIERVSGRLDLRTGDGNIRATELRGALKAYTDDGSLRLLDVNGQADIYSGDGGIELAGTLSGVRARTGDGSVTVRAEPGSLVGDAWEIRTGDGSVTLEVPDSLGAELDASTADGSVRVEGVPLSVTGGRERQSVRGTLAAGGRPLRVRTGSGTIHIRRF